MSETMIHKVAMAIAEADLSDGPDDSTYDFFALPEEIVDGYYRIARSAIKAMRDPSHEMMRAMFEAMFEAKFDGTLAPMMGAGFEAAIDAALKEQTK